jgi:hypothetical protein
LQSAASRINSMAGWFIALIVEDIIVTSEER